MQWQHTDMSYFSVNPKITSFNVWFSLFFIKSQFFDLVYIFSVALAACVIMRYLGGSYGNNRAL